MSYSVVKNTSFLTAASILQKIISFVYFTIIARVIGVGDTGQYFFALTFTTIFTVVADFGLGQILIRETARNPENSERNLNTVFWTKVIFGLAAYLLVIFFINVFNYAPEIKQLVYLSGVTMFFDNLHATFYALFRARKNLFYESVGVVASQFLTLTIGTVALLMHWPMIWLIAAYAIPSFLNFLFSAFSARRVYKLHYGFIWDKNLFKTFIALAVPFALAGIIGRLYSYSDSLIMSKMLSRDELGWWSVPYKITFAFQFIPVALSASIFPVMSGLYIQSKEKIGQLFQKSWHYLFIIIFPLSFGLFVLAELIVTKIYKPEYLPSVPVLRVLLISLIFGFLSFITGALLNASNRQKVQTALVAVALVVNIIMNVILLPRVGIIGAAFSALAGNIILCFGGIYFAGQFAVLDFKRIFISINQTLWPALIMAMAVYYMSQWMNFLITIPIGAVLYFILLFITGGLSASMIKEAKEKIFIKSDLAIVVDEK